MTLSDSTFNSWFNRTASLLEPLYEQLVKQVQQQEQQQQDYLQADESPIKVQDNHKQGATHLGYHWVYYSPKEKLAVFDYQPSRSREGLRKFLQNFKGSLQTDGYSAYDEFGKREHITLLACMAHVQRYFEKALDNAENEQNMLCV
ncbi:MAG: transposase [Cytophagales bacterium]|nr:transposase [Cytophagales bacterium]